LTGDRDGSPRASDSRVCHRRAARPVLRRARLTGRYRVPSMVRPRGPISRTRGQGHHRGRLRKSRLGTRRLRRAPATASAGALLIASGNGSLGLRVWEDIARPSANRCSTLRIVLRSSFIAECPGARSAVKKGPGFVSGPGPGRGLRGAPRAGKRKVTSPYSQGNTLARQRSTLTAFRGGRLPTEIVKGRHGVTSDIPGDSSP
jgi:hypothetical protein